MSRIERKAERFSKCLRDLANELYCLGGCSEDEVVSACAIVLRGASERFLERLGDRFVDPTPRNE